MITLMTTILIDDGQAVDLELHKERLKQGCLQTGYAWHEPLLPEIAGRARLKITCDEEGLQYASEPLPSYNPSPLALLLKRDEGLSLKTTHSLERRAWGDRLTINHAGLVLQASCANLFWVIEDVFYTPCFEKLPLVKGTCLSRLLTIFPFIQVCWSIEELLRKKPYLFLCNAVKEIVPISQVEDVFLPTDEMLLCELLGQYRRMRYSTPLMTAVKL